MDSKRPPPNEYNSGWGEKWIFFKECPYFLFKLLLTLLSQVILVHLRLPYVSLISFVLKWFNSSLSLFSLFPKSAGPVV